jgi:hypothetical protein
MGIARLRPYCTSVGRSLSRISLSVYPVYDIYVMLCVLLLFLSVPTWDNANDAHITTGKDRI